MSVYTTATAADVEAMLATIGVETVEDLFEPIPRSLLVDEALLIEPVETETKETLDAFAEAIAAVLAEAADDPEIARTARHDAPVRRLDEARAAKRPVIRQQLDPEEVPA